MSWWHTPGQGDWVTLTRHTPVTISDHLTGGGLPAGTKAVVIERHGGRLTVEADDGWGTCTATVDSSDVRVTRRDGGRERFASRIRLLTTIRIALALFLAWPFIWFTAQYLWIYHTLNGIVPAFILSVLDSIPDQIQAALNQPLKAILSTLLFAVFGRIAWGKHH